MSPTRVTTDMVVKFDVFEGEVSYTSGLLLGAACEAEAAGDTGRARVLHAAMQEVSRDNRDVDIKQIDAKTADLRRLRQEMLS